MEFTNTFTVPVTPDRAFALLTDLERVAPCMPGATLEEVEGDTYHGRVKVKVGPMSVTYKGSATIVALDEDGLTASIEASGTEARGAGTASAKVTASMRSVDDGTEVTVVTDLTVTGKPAQFGRGVMADVGSKIIDKFADCLAGKLEKHEEPQPAEAAEAASAASAAEAASAASEVPASSGAGEAPPSGEAATPAAGREAVVTGAREAASSNGQQRRRVQEVAPEEEALDLMEVAGGATARRLIPLAAGLMAVLGILWWWRRR